MDAASGDASHLVVGAWRLVSFEIHRGDREVVRPFGDDPRGSLMYSEGGRFSAQVMRPGRPAIASGDQMTCTPEEAEANFKGCISYFGAYEVDAEAGALVHHVEQSLLPNWEGTSQQRFFERAGDTLTLRTAPTTWGGGEIVAVLAWERA